MIHYDRIIANLRAAGLTYKQIAQRIRVSKHTVVAWAVGARRPTHYRVVLPLLDLHLDLCPQRHRVDVIGKP